MQLGLLVSGGLGLVAFERLRSRFPINFVLTDRRSVAIVSRCMEQGIAWYAGNPRLGKALASLPAACDVLVSVNYLYLVERDLISLPRKLAVNFHGSLLPRYRGRTPHVWAIINNERESGITAHVMDEDVDSGDIIAQRVIPIAPTDTGATMLEKYAAIYPGFILEVLADIDRDTFTLTKQDPMRATYFGARTADDGRIDWNWQRERIYNWVRAQAKPYPGAFSYYGDRRVVVHSTRFSAAGFRYDLPNGTIIAVRGRGPIVKAPNGCVELVDFEFEGQFVVGRGLC